MNLTPAFQGILVAKGVDPSAFAGMVPEGMQPVTALHMTLLSSELDKDARKQVKKAFNPATLPPFPSVTFGQPYEADNGAKRSMVVDANEQNAIRTWCKLACAVMGLPEGTVNEARVYHVSIANPTGSQFDSVPDPWNHKV